MRFWHEENGAVTTDWIVLTAAIGGLCISAVATIRGSVEALAFGVQQSLSGAQISMPGTLGFIAYTAPSLLIMGGVNFNEVTADLRDTLRTATDSEVRDLAITYADAVANSPICSGVRSCAVDIDHVAMALTELQYRQVPSALVQEVDTLYQTARARWD
jgi:hypothetical protein